MRSQGSGRKVLRFAVTGALLGGGAMTGCASKQQTNNVAPVEDPEPRSNVGPEEDAHTNMGPEDEPHSNAGPEEEPDTNPGPEGEPVAKPDGKIINTAPVSPPPGPDEERPKPRVVVNPAPQPDPGS